PEDELGGPHSGPSGTSFNCAAGSPLFDTSPGLGYSDVPVGLRALTAADVIAGTTTAPTVYLPQQPLVRPSDGPTLFRSPGSTYVAGPHNDNIFSERFPPGAPSVPDYHVTHSLVALPSEKAKNVELANGSTSGSGAALAAMSSTTSSTTIPPPSLCDGYLVL